jgi:putative ABC transport system permease protein
VKAYPKLMLRAVRGSMSRFLAIFAIAALGVGFLAGLLAATPDMKDTMEDHYDRWGLMDLRILSTVGLGEADLQALREFPGVERAVGGKNADVVILTESEARLAVTLHALQGQDAAFSGLELVSGRWPENPGECLAETYSGGISHPFELGELVTVPEGYGNPEDLLNGQQFTVVGPVASPYYASMDREATSVGSGVGAGMPKVAVPHCASASVPLTGTAPT